MFRIKSKKIRLSLCLCVISMLLTPALTQADTAIVLAEVGTGPIAASKAADQKAALAKKAAEREARKAAESLKPAEVQTPATAPVPAEEQKEK